MGTVGTIRLGDTCRREFEVGSAPMVRLTASFTAPGVVALARPRILPSTGGCGDKLLPPALAVAILSLIAPGAVARDRRKPFPSALPGMAAPTSGEEAAAAAVCTVAGSGCIVTGFLPLLSPRLSEPLCGAAAIRAVGPDLLGESDLDVAWAIPGVADVWI